MKNANRPHVLRSACAALLFATLAVQAQPSTERPPVAEPTTAAQTEPKVLRYAFQIAETGFDPAQLSDLYSRAVTAHIFESLYQFDHLARPAKVVPLTAAGMPEMSADYRTVTVRIQPGIYFTDHPAFKGKKRELVAEDYVYSFKRFADPAVKSPGWGSIEENRFLGLNELRQQALKTKQPFDYAKPIEGIRALDRYTIQFRMAEPRPRLEQFLAQPDIYGAVAREVIEQDPATSMERPVGTGPFVLKQWRRSSLIVLEKNPDYRVREYDAQPAADDAAGQAMLSRFKGRRLPLIDRVEISVVEETQPRWLSFLNGQHNYLERVPEDFINQAMPGGKIAPNLAKQGIQGERAVGAEIVLLVFNMEDPVVGGYTPDKVALRRAISLGYNTRRDIDLVRRGQAILAQSPVVPHTTGYDPTYKSEMSDYDPARAKALLDLYGYKDADGDGWRDLPDGKPLVLVRHTQPSARDRSLDEILRKDMNTIGIKVEFKTAKWPENLKTVRSGKFQMWGVASSSAFLDGQGALARVYGPQTGSQNLARFKLQQLDAVYDRMQAMPDGPERLALFREVKRLTNAYAPYKNMMHRLVTDLWHGELVGYRRPDFWLGWWQYVDIDPQARTANPSQP